jgi:PAS domain S-box-containing protein
MMPNETSLRVEVLGQLLLMQSVLINLSENQSMVSFVCRGLKDIPGVAHVDFCEDVLKDSPFNIVCFPMGKKGVSFGEFRITLSDQEQYMPYHPYVTNFMIMIDVILEERHQRILNEQHQQELEKRVEQRTQQLMNVIRDREQIEESLKQSNNLMRLAGEKAKLGGWFVNVKDTKMFWSDEVAAIHDMPSGYNPTVEEAMNFYAPEWREKIAIVFSRCAREGVSYEEEMEIITSKGRRAWVRTMGEALKDHNGKIIRVQGTYQDITERVQNEIKLRESEEKYRTFIETMQDGVYRSTPEGKFLEVNMAMVKILGYESKEELMGVDIKKELYFDEAERESAVLEEKHSEMAIFRMRRKDGSEVWVQDHGHLVQDPNGKIIFHEGTIRDITEHLKAEEAMRQVEIAKESARIKQNFLANMSHEMRTPLTGLLGMIELLEDTAITEVQKDYLNTIKLSGENLREIINQVLDFSKMEAGKATLKPSVFELKYILNHLSVLYKNINRHKIALKFHLDDSLPPYIYADKSRIFQVVNNLVSNAMKFTREGSIRINIIDITPGGSTEDLKIKIEVIDTGIGIPVDLQQKLFIPFSQIEDNDIRNYEGTGLGLSICKELVNLLGGEIGVISEHHKGSTFWFTFSAKGARVPMAGAAPISKTTPKDNLRILFAEDKVINQKVVSLMLTSLGHEITIANEGEQALEIFQPGKFDLILMDIQMPVMDGITATQQLKSKYSDLPPIVGLSANAFEGDREKYMALGMDEYLTKPVKRDDFHQLMEKLFPNTYS